MRAIGIVRQSKGREESLSPAEQRERIASVCERENLELVEVHEEIDVSGGTPLAQREGLRAAVESIEGGSAQVVVVAYFDRLFRSLAVQGEVVERIEKAGGRIFAADVGEVSGATAGSWISSGVLGLVSEYYRRSVRERSGEAQRMAVAEGRPPFGSFPPGYVRGEDGCLVPVAKPAAAVRRAFDMRVGGAPLHEVRAFLREQGIERSYHGVQAMLASRIYLGELHFGDLVNLEAHEPIIDRDLWEAVQQIKRTRGGRPKSDRLLARQGVLRCDTCGGGMVVGFQTTSGKRYDFYRCVPISDCPRRVTISADMVEGLVVDAVKAHHANLRGQASVEDDARGAESAAVRAQEDLDAAIRAFAGLETEPAAVERIRELRDLRDVALEEASHLRGLSSVLSIDLTDWPGFTLEERRAIIRDTLAEVRVAPGRGLGRVTVSFVE